MSLHLALGRVPEPVDAAALEDWQTAQDARLQAFRERSAQDLADAAEADPDLLDRLVDELELSVRTANALRDLGIVTLRDLCARSEADLLRCKGLGRKSMRELREILGELGLTLGTTDGSEPGASG